MGNKIQVLKKEQMVYKYLPTPRARLNRQYTSDNAITPDPRLSTTRSKNSANSLDNCIIYEFPADCLKKIKK